MAVPGRTGRRKKSHRASVLAAAMAPLLAEAHGKLDDSDDD